MNISKERNQKIELLRIILMTLIVFGHIIGHGIGGGRYDVDGKPTMEAMLQPLYLYHVDAFIFISGYFGIKLKWNKFFNLLLKWLLCSVVAVAIVMCVSENYSLLYLIKNIFPISTCDHWFMAQYMYLMLMAPLLNTGMETLNRKQSTVLMAVMYISSFRFYSCLMVFIYLLGRHFRKYPSVKLEKYSVVVFIATLISFSLFNYFCLLMKLYPGKMYEYMSPFLIVAAVSLFYSFKKIHVKFKGVGFIASGVLATYLITDHELLRPIFTKNAAVLCDYSPFYILLLSIAVTLLCSVFDAIVFSHISKTTSVIWQKGIRKFLLQNN